MLKMQKTNCSASNAAGGLLSGGHIPVPTGQSTSADPPSAQPCEDRVLRLIQHRKDRFSAPDRSVRRYFQCAGPGFRSEGHRFFSDGPRWKNIHGCSSDREKGNQAGREKNGSVSRTDGACSGAAETGCFLLFSLFSLGKINNLCVHDPRGIAFDGVGRT